MADPQKKTDAPSIKEDGKRVVINGNFYIGTASEKEKSDGFRGDLFVQSIDASGRETGPKVPLHVSSEGHLTQTLALQGTQPVKLSVRPKAIRSLDVEVADGHTVTLDYTQNPKVTLTKGTLRMEARPVDVLQAGYKEGKEWDTVNFKGAEVSFMSKGERQNAQVEFVDKQGKVLAAADNKSGQKGFVQAVEPVRAKITETMKKLEQQPRLTDEDQKLAFTDFDKKKKDVQNENERLQKDLNKIQEKIGKDIKISPDEKKALVSNSIKIITNKVLLGLTPEKAREELDNIPNIKPEMKILPLKTIETHGKQAALHRKQDKWLKDNAALLKEAEDLGISLDKNKEPLPVPGLGKSKKSSLVPNPALENISPAMKKALEQSLNTAYKPPTPAGYQTPATIAASPDLPQHKGLSA